MKPKRCIATFHDHYPGVAIAPLAVNGFDRPVWRVDLIKRHIERCTQANGGHLEVIEAIPNNACTFSVLASVIVYVGHAETGTPRMVRHFEKPSTRERVSEHFKSVLPNEYRPGMLERSREFVFEPQPWELCDGLAWLDAYAKQLVGVPDKAVRRAVCQYCAERGLPEPGRHLIIPPDVRAAYAALGW